MRGKHVVAALQCGPPLLDERGVFAHLSDRHAGAAQPVHQLQPAHVRFAVDASAATVARHTGDQPLSLIPADGVRAAPRARRKFADVQLAHGSSHVANT